MESALIKSETMSDIEDDDDRPLEEDQATDGVAKTAAMSDADALPPEAEALFRTWDAASADRCRESGRIIVRAVRKTTLGEIEIGYQLTLRKKELGHGRFGPYCEAFGIEKRHAQRCKQVAKHFWHERELVSALRFSELAALSVKAVPQRVRDAVVGQLKAGQRPGRSAIRAMIKEAVEKKPADSDTEGEQPDTTGGTTDTAGEKSDFSAGSDEAPDGQASSVTDRVEVAPPADTSTTKREDMQPPPELPMAPRRTAPLAFHAQSVVQSEDQSSIDDVSPDMSAVELLGNGTRALSDAENAARMIRELGHEWKSKFWQKFRNADDEQFMHLLRQYFEEEFGTKEPDAF